MTLFDAIVTGAYVAVTCSLAVFGAHRVWLLLRFRWRARAIPPPDGNALPFVTVQLPMYNERTVAERIIRASASLDYPRECLEIQILDDSTDQTRGIVDREVERLHRQGITACVLRRAARTGFKAGALAHGLRAARGDLICIFDADFVPRPDFLQQVVGVFRDPCIGMVQARWVHLNREESPFTRAQAALLDAHFVITHEVRFERGLFFHFNGTAGIWRRETIERAGGWQHDTLTEDLDLSYRAQLAGDRFFYAAQVEAPAELPADIAAFKTQQTRWARGAVQVGRKLGGQMLRSRERPRIKLEAALHFLAHAGHALVLALVVLLPFAVTSDLALMRTWYLALPALSLPAVLLSYETAMRALGRPLRSRLADSCLAVVLGLGMCWSLTRAVLAGLGADRGVFVRTPKRGDAASRSYVSRLHEPPGVELLLAAWSFWGVTRALAEGRMLAGLVLCLYATGFAWVGWLSLLHALSMTRSAPAAARLPRPSVAPSRADLP